MKLIENLKAVETGNRRHIVEPLHSIKLTFDKDPIAFAPRFAKEYAIIVTIGANEWIAEDLIQASDGKVIKHAVEDMKHAIIEHADGSFTSMTKAHYDKLQAEQSTPMVAGDE
jgi:hypothetical protein